MATEVKEASVEEKLKALYDLQKVSTEIDKIRTIRGELPLEVEDLRDEISGLKTRVEKLEAEVKNLSTSIVAQKNQIKENDIQIKKYEAQQESVRNSREYDTISKEIEYIALDKQLCEKRIKEFQEEMKRKQELFNNAVERVADREKDLAVKEGELENIITETKSEEEKLEAKAAKISKTIDERLLAAFNRIRGNARNGMAVATVQRDACGGCFNHIPPQRQLDIRLRKKVIVCEYCGRILVDDYDRVENAAE